MAPVTREASGFVIKVDKRGHLRPFLNGVRIPGVIGVDVKSAMDGSEVTIRVISRVITFEHADGD